MHHHADTGFFEQRRLCPDGVLRFQLEAPPVGPDRRAGSRFAQQAGNLIGFGRMVDGADARSEEHTSELQSLMRISYAVFCLKKKNISTNNITKYLKQTDQ